MQHCLLPLLLKTHAADILRAPNTSAFSSLRCLSRHPALLPPPTLFPSLLNAPLPQVPPAIPYQPTAYNFSNRQFGCNTLGSPSLERCHPSQVPLKHLHQLNPKPLVMPYACSSFIVVNVAPLLSPLSSCAGYWFHRRIKRMSASPPLSSTQRAQPCTLNHRFSPAKSSCPNLV